MFGNIWKEKKIRNVCIGVLAFLSIVFLVIVTIEYNTPQTIQFVDEETIRESNPLEEGWVKVFKNEDNTFLIFTGARRKLFSLDQKNRLLERATEQWIEQNSTLYDAKVDYKCENLFIALHVVKKEKAGKKPANQ